MERSEELIRVLNRDADEAGTALFVVWLAEEETMRVAEQRRAEEAHEWSMGALAFAKKVWKHNSCWLYQRDTGTSLANASGSDVNKMGSPPATERWASMLMMRRPRTCTTLPAAHLQCKEE